MNRILFLTPNLCSGGAERQLVTVACLLKKQGHDVAVYCYDKADFYEYLLKEAGVPIIWDLTPCNYFKRIWNVRQHIRKGRYDAVISYMRTPNILNVIASIGGKNWKVITGERSAKDYYFRTRTGKIYGWLLKFADCIVCNSNNAKKMWLSRFPSYNNKLYVIYNIVKLGLINTDYTPKKDGRLHILVAATYQYLKNPIGLAKAIIEMSAEERRTICVDWYGRQEIAKGDKKAFDEVRTIIEVNRLSDVFILHGDTIDIANLMYQADVVMLLSKLEGLPNVICEAMSMGKPIIMTRVSDYNMLVDQDNGLLCDWDNPVSIKDCIIKMSNLETGQLIKMGEISKKKAKALFSEEIILKAWENLLI